MTVHLDMGLHTFGDVTADVDGALRPQAVVIRNLIDQAALADELGVDFIGVGEHHRADFAVSAPEIVLAAIASRTKRIRLGSATTVLSSDDPIRVFERFAAYKVMRDRVGRDRGWPPMQRAEFDRETAHGSLYVGSPQTVARRIADTVKALGVARFDMKYSAGPLSHQNMMRCIELYGTEVIPLVREMINHDSDLTGSTPTSA